MGQTRVDWTVLDLPGVTEVVQKAASSIATSFKGVTEAADLAQEAFILLASEPHVVRNYVANDELGLLYNRVRQRLHNEATRLAGYSNRVVSIQNFQEVDQ